MKDIGTMTLRELQQHQLAVEKQLFITAARTADSLRKQAKELGLSDELTISARAGTLITPRDFVADIQEVTLPTLPRRSGGKPQRLTQASALRAIRSAAGNVKFRDPKNPKNTWSGRGRMAGWLAAAIKEGKKLEHFRV